MVRAAASKNNKQLAVFFASMITEYDRSSGHIARSGEWSVFYVFAQCFPELVRTNSRRGLTQLEFNKALENNGFSRIRKRTQQTIRFNQKTKNSEFFLPSSFRFRNRRWRNPDNIQDRQFLSAGWDLLTKSEKVTFSFDSLLDLIREAIAKDNELGDTVSGSPSASRPASPAGEEEEAEAPEASGHGADVDMTHEAAESHASAASVPSITEDTSPSMIKAKNKGVGHACPLLAPLFSFAVKAGGQERPSEAERKDDAWSFAKNDDEGEQEKKSPASTTDAGSTSDASPSSATRSAAWHLNSPPTLPPPTQIKAEGTDLAGVTQLVTAALLQQQQQQQGLSAAQVSPTAQSASPRSTQPGQSPVIIQLIYMNPPTSLRNNALPPPAAINIPVSLPSPSNSVSGSALALPPADGKQEGVSSDILAAFNQLSSLPPQSSLSLPLPSPSSVLPALSGPQSLLASLPQPASLH